MRSVNTNQGAPEGRRPRGRPRSETARRAILAAALELGGERDAAELTMDAIARRAAVSKETLYRWWRSKGDVLLEALVYRGEEAIPIPDSGTLERDLRAFMRATAKALDQPTRRLLRSLAAQAAADTRFAETMRERFLARRRAALATVLERAVQRGELSAPGAALALDLVFGTLWYRLIFATAALDREWADALTDAIASTSTRTITAPGHQPKGIRR